MNNDENQKNVTIQSAKCQGDIGTSLRPYPNTIVSCRGLNGENNALVVGYCGNCSYDPPMVMIGIVPTRFSYHMIKETGCFVINLADKTNKELFDYCGSHSGRDGNKLSAIHAKLAEGLKVNAPILSDCPVNIECTVVDSIRTGSHEMFIGKVEYVHVNKEYSNDNGSIKFSEINFL